MIANFGEINIPESRVPLLAALQASGAAGLLLGLLGVPFVGIASAIGLILFFVGAVVTHLRSGAYASIPSPALFLTLAIATLVFTVIR